MSSKIDLLNAYWDTLIEKPLYSEFNKKMEASDEIVQLEKENPVLGYGLDQKETAKETHEAQKLLEETPELNYRKYISTLSFIATLYEMLSGEGRLFARIENERIIGWGVVENEK